MGNSRRIQRGRQTIKEEYTGSWETQEEYRGRGKTKEE